MAIHKTLLVGLGSRHGDDAIGWRLAEQIAGHALPGLQVRQASTPLDVLDWLDRPDRLVLCDACASHAAMGTVHRWDWPAAPWDCRAGRGSHDFTLPQVLELAHRLGRLPSDVWVYAVAGAQFKPGTGLSPALLAALPAIVNRILGELGHARTFAGASAAQAD